MHNVTVDRIKFSPFRCLTDWFSSIENTAGAVLLHSGDSTHENAKFHIASGSPIFTLKLFADGRLNCHYQIDDSWHMPDSGQKKLQAVYNEFNNATIRPADIVNKAHEIKIRLFGDTSKNSIDLPFQCGLIGFAAYDFGRFLEILPGSALDEYQTPVFTANFYSWSVLENQVTKKAYLCFSEEFACPRFNLVTIPSAGQRFYQPWQNQPRQTAEFRLTETWQSNMGEADYLQKLDRIHEYLLAGDCYQVNLAQRFKAPYQGSEWAAFEALTEVNPAPFSAFIRNDESCIISCSPERFLSVKGDIIETKPIKGTRPRFNDPIDDEDSRQALINSEKDQAENLMIVDLLRNDISKNAVANSVEVTGLFEIESFSAVHHMVSTIRARLKPSSHPLQLLQDAFPGGSITGAPKIRAMEVIDELEPHRRNIYCGSIFYLGVSQDFDSSICIRTLLFESGQVYCWAGGGIVADSEPQAEYEETFHKVRKILPTIRFVRKKAL